MRTNTKDVRYNLLFLYRIMSLRLLWLMRIMSLRLLWLMTQRLHFQVHQSEILISRKRLDPAQRCKMTFIFIMFIFVIVYDTVTNVILRGLDLHFQRSKRETLLSRQPTVKAKATRASRRRATYK